MRELRNTQEEFRRVASRMNGGDPLAAWAKAKEDHPAAGELVPVAQQQLQELSDFIQRNNIITIPDGEPVSVAPTPRFYRWTFASMWTPGPFETRASRAMYYLTDADPSWPPQRQAEHLRDFNTPTLWTISMHEVFPGHYLHYQHLRRVASKVRRSTLFAPASYIEGWAHYCEQMMLEAGFGRGDSALKLGQLGEALVRLARFVVGIRLHADDWSVEQGVRFFREEAFLEDAARPLAAITPEGVEASAGAQAADAASSAPAVFKPQIFTSVVMIWPGPFPGATYARRVRLSNRPAAPALARGQRRAGAS